jgi:acyl-CoA synthetase (AMP-forming)/AMP-acid ligase II
MIDDSAPGGNGAGEGELLVRGPHVMRGYYRNPEETVKAITPDGWLRTGDLGKIDEAGLIYILGRSKELIIHGGFNVYPPEVEAALNDHPQVIQSAVIGHMVEGDEQVLAFVQIAEGDTLSVEALHGFVKERLTGYKRPRRIVLATALPAAPTGKILKHKLMETFAAELG